MTITVAAGNTPRKRQLAHPRRQARYIARRLLGRGQVWTNKGRRDPVHSFSVCEMGNGLRLRLRANPLVRVVAPRHNAKIGANRIGNGIITSRKTVAVEQVTWVRFPDYVDKGVTRGLFWPVAIIRDRETGERYVHCSVHLPTRSRASDYERGRMLTKARDELERCELPIVLSGDFNWGRKDVRDRLGDGWDLAARTDVMMIWVRGFDVVGFEVDTSVQGTLTDHSGFISAALHREDGELAWV